MNVPFFIAKRYLLGKKTSQSVNFIVGISILALLVSTAAMLIFLSIFSGLEQWNIDQLSQVKPDIRISPAQGKYIANPKEVENTLASHSEISQYARVIEEKVYMTYRERDEIAYMKAVDKDYKNIFRIDTCIDAFSGQYLSFETDDEIIMGYGLQYVLNIPVSETETAKLFMPKPGEGSILNPTDAFVTQEVFLKGVFYTDNEEFNKCVVVPISLGEKLLNLPLGTAGVYEVRLKIPEKRNEWKEKLQQELGKAYTVETKEDLDSVTLKMMNIEKLIIYLLLTLIVIITCFNLWGAIVIIILDKKIQSHTLFTIGFSLKELKKTYFYTGLWIVAIGIGLGLILGTLVLLGQLYFGWVKITFSLPYPVEMRWQNFALVISTVFIIGWLVSYFASRRIKIQ